MALIGNAVANWCRIGTDGLLNDVPKLKRQRLPHRPQDLQVQRLVVPGPLAGCGIHQQIRHGHHHRGGDDDSGDTLAQEPAEAHGGYQSFRNR